MSGIAKLFQDTRENQPKRRCSGCHFSKVHTGADGENWFYTCELPQGIHYGRDGIPETLISDNGRAFASKQITGGQATRNHYKMRKDEPRKCPPTTLCAFHTDIKSGRPA